ncbi:unnamed protein product [Lasius platythorax]|uniref:Uncharacterized protein n=1 Tax=Lasius platythorax TaxID=488582 RepID=A0AAV2P7X1_9HYME
MLRIKPFSEAKGHAISSSAVCLPGDGDDDDDDDDDDGRSIGSPKSRKEGRAVDWKKGGTAGRVCLENVIGIVTRGPVVGFLTSRTCGAFGIFVSLLNKK